MPRFSGSLKGDLLLIPLLAAIAFSTLEPTTVAQDPDDLLAQFEYKRDANNLVLRVKIHAPRIGQEEPVQRLRIFGDGHVEIFNPVGWKKAGSYRLQLTDQELLELLRFCADRGFMELDTAALQDEIKMADERRSSESQRTGGGPVTRFIMGGGTVIIETIVDSYTPADSPDETEVGVRRRISWSNVSVYARVYPEISALAGLSEVTRRLMAITQDPDLEPAVDETSPQQ